MSPKSSLLTFCILALAALRADAAPKFSILRRQNGGGDPQSSQSLDPAVVATGFQNDGQDNPSPGQVASLTSNNNFINFCLTRPDLPVTNGQQIKTGSCNPAPMGIIADTDHMPSAKFQNPKNGDDLAENQPFTIQLAMNNLETGHFTNAQENYYSAPQQVTNDGTIIGHTHVVIEQLDSLDQTQPTDPKKFAFFKGINGAAQGGVVTADVTDGLPAGTYRMATINAAANHQPVLVAVAQHGSLDDMIYFTVGGNGNNNNNNGQNNGGNGQDNNGNGNGGDNSGNGQDQNGNGADNSGNGQDQNGNDDGSDGQNGNNAGVDPNDPNAQANGQDGSNNGSVDPNDPNAQGNGQDGSNDGSFDPNDPNAQGNGQDGSTNGGFDPNDPNAQDGSNNGSFDPNDPNAQDPNAQDPNAAQDGSNDGSFDPNDPNAQGNGQDGSNDGSADPNDPNAQANNGQDGNGNDGSGNGNDGQGNGNNNVGGGAFDPNSLGADFGSDGFGGDGGNGFIAAPPSDQSDVSGDSYTASNNYAAGNTYAAGAYNY